MESTAHNKINRRIHEWLGHCWHEIRFRTNEEREPIYGLFGQHRGFKLSALTDICEKCQKPVKGLTYTNGRTDQFNEPTAYQDGNYHYTDSLEACDLLIKALQRKGYEIDINISTHGVFDVDIYKVGHEITSHIGYDSLPMTLSLVVDKLILATEGK
jgi:hypothetical protein